MSELELLFFMKMRGAKMDLDNVDRVLEKMPSDDPSAKGLYRIRAARRERYNTLYELCQEARLYSKYEEWAQS
jgi:hypothetical protein